MAEVIEVPQRSKTLISLEIVDNETGEPIDITGWTVYFTAKPEFDEDDTDAQAFIKHNITDHDNATYGRTSFITTIEETDIDAGDYPFDIKLKNADGTLLEGSAAGILRILKAVTRRSS